MRTNDRTHAWIVVVLLFIFVVINFADKAVIGIAAVPIMQELHLGPRQFGLVGSSFYVLFAVSSVATGFLVNRMHTRWVLLVMGLIPGADAVSDDRLGRVRNPGGLSYRARGRRRSRNTGGIALRLQVVPQRTAHPSDRRHCARRGDRRHGGTAAAQLVIVHWTWHWAFGSLGLVGLLWCALWLVFSAAKGRWTARA